MTFAQAATTYITANVLLCLAFGSVASIAIILKVLGRPLRYQIELKLQYFILAMVVGISVVHPLIPQKDIFKPFAKVWVAESGKNFAHSYSSTDIGGYISSSADSSRMLEVGSIGFLILGVAFFLFVLSSLKWRRRFGSVPLMVV